MTFDKKLKRLAGTSNLKKNPAKIERDPKPRQIKCSLWVNGTVFKDCPPNSIQSIWMATVMMRMIKKSGLLKKFLNTLSSVDFNFLALTSLKI